MLTLQESIPHNFLLDLQVFKMVPVELRKLAPHLREISPGLPKDVMATEVREIGRHNRKEVFVRAPHIAVLKLRRWPRGCIELKDDWGVI